MYVNSSVSLTMTLIWLKSIKCSISWLQKQILTPAFLYRRLVSGAGDIKLTKDGNVLLHEMVSTRWMKYLSHCFILLLIYSETDCYVTTPLLLAWC